MNLSTPASILAVIFVFVLIKHWMDAKAKQDRDRLRLIEEALRQGNLDDQSRETLVGSLTGRQPEAAKRRAAGRSGSSDQVGFFFKLMAFVGWITFCVGIAFVLIIANTYGNDVLAVPAMILGCVGFGLLTFPFIVLRELSGPKGRHAAEPRS